MFKFKLNKKYLLISKEILVVFLMDIFAAAYYISSRSLSGASRMFPSFLLLGILLFSILCCIQGVHVYREDDEQMEEMCKGAPDFGISRKLILFTAMVLITLLLFNIAGALVCCWWFLISAMWILDVRDIRVLIIIPLFEVIFVYFVFVVWLAVPLPEGLLAFL